MSTRQFSDLPSLFNYLNIKDLSDHDQSLIYQINQLLPQTQCGLCGHADGCLPYATAIIKDNEPHNKCVPSGQIVANKIATLLDREILAAVPSRWQTDPNTSRPMEVRAVIREDDCIGCTKCIPACPVDAIVGSGKQMHTIFTDLCTGCELCLPPCPMDCIELIPHPRAISDTERYAEQADLQKRYYKHLERIEQQVNDKTNAKPVISMVQAKLNDISVNIDENQAKNTIESAKLRTQLKKLEKQLSVKFDTTKQQQYDELLQKLAKLG
ncbi:RnfABCDGE type electron transport complex subunit B [Moraxella macacae 0408225]|uniref:RnfABCDGE type electron transport complex subunit B n=1 Tax=Moraxella macacae 0408225 TaxID=1230338 RepID=L2FB59_9GAMM|nr:RnfABCDGE type electron transport complex subunit B [Moraxella macacae]ELA09673.1 RnfABCDGE type electron transport complex subunit B [Moraxella macacae 0408225]